MGYTSTNILSNYATISKVKNLIELLGYEKSKDDLKAPKLIASYFWYDHKNY